MWRNWASRSRCWRPSLTLRWPGANTPAGATVAHRTSRHLEALTDQLVSQLGRRLRRPTQLRHRVAPSLGVHELVEGLQESGLLRLGFDVTAADGALAVRGHDPGLHLPLGLDHSVTAHPPATAVLPPRPNISAIAPATTRRCISFMCGTTTSKNRASPSAVTWRGPLASRRQAPSSDRAAVPVVRQTGPPRRDQAI